MVTAVNLSREEAIAALKEAILRKAGWLATVSSPEVRSFELVLSADNDLLGVSSSVGATLPGGLLETLMRQAAPSTETGQISPDTSAPTG